MNGPNLNMLGRREPDIYGTQTLEDIEKSCAEHVQAFDGEIEFFQTNHEGVFIERIQEALGRYDAIIVNAAGYTHTSVAIHDALKLLSCPIIEVHISNPLEREEFRHHSYISPVAAHVIAGQGTDGYLQAIDKIKEIIENAGE